MSEIVPPVVRSLLQEHIRSIAQLALLLKMHGRRTPGWSVAEAAKSLYTAESTTKPLLDSLLHSGLISCSDGPNPLYQFAPKSEELGKAVDELADLYHDRRTSIVNLIYSAPEKSLQDFADAFRIRKRGE